MQPESPKLNDAQKGGLIAHYVKTLFSAKSPLWIQILLVFALVYLVCPIDIIPDFIVGIGWLDDLFMILTAIGLIPVAIPKPNTYTVELVD
ncbi:MAG: DUF1232 domain-containing protein [Desulfobulbaceae bacterium]|nr:DUF1232 domain-containing protein [Desulfobulbaceae bacterium]